MPGGDYIDESAQCIRDDSPFPLPLHDPASPPKQSEHLEYHYPTSDCIKPVNPKRTPEDLINLFPRLPTEPPGSDSGLLDDSSDSAGEAEVDMRPVPQDVGSDANAAVKAAKQDRRPSSPLLSMAMVSIDTTANSVRQLKDTAAAACRESERNAAHPANSNHSAVNTSEMHARSFHGPLEREPRGSGPLKLETTTTRGPPQPPLSQLRDNHPDTSSSLRGFAMSASEADYKLSPIVPRPSLPQQLPSFSHVAHNAGASEQQRPNVPVSPRSRTHSRSLSSIASSSQLPPFSHASAATRSPTTPYPLSAGSPTSTLGDPAQHESPHGYLSSLAQYSSRRPSSTSQAIPLRTPKLSHQNTASSSESAGTVTSSSNDEISTAHTSPSEGGPPMAESARRRLQLPLPLPLPLPPAMPAIYQCKHADCDGPTFATQYLLSSHENKHSSERPHYCPVQDCPHSVGGIGFKRKNEMTRHGLVHNSPGFVCPFCVNREHSYSYPRSDNLLRHVKVHHADRDRNDPLLQEVLDQGGKKRRRKTESERAPAR